MTNFWVAITSFAWWALNTRAGSCLSTQVLYYDPDLVGYVQPPELVLHPDRMAQIDLLCCHAVKHREINQTISLCIWCRIQLEPYRALVECGTQWLVASIYDSYSSRNLYVFYVCFFFVYTIICGIKINIYHVSLKCGRALTKQNNIRA